MKRISLSRISVTVVGMLLTLLIGAACNSLDQSHREIVATNAEWTITAIGNIQARGPAFGVNAVRFEAVHSGAVSPYASGELYVAGPHDDSFANEFDEREWLWPNVLAFYNKPPRELRTLSLTVRNESGAAVRWLRINTDELFLILRLPPASSVDLLTRRWADETGVSVRGALEDGVVLATSERRASASARHADISVRGHGTDVSFR